VFRFFVNYKNLSRVISCLHVVILMHRDCKVLFVIGLLSCSFEIVSEECSSIFNRKDSYDVSLNPFGDGDPEDEVSADSVQPMPPLSSSDASFVASGTTAAAVTESAVPPSTMPLSTTTASITTAY